MKFGTLVRISDLADAQRKFAELNDSGFQSCQLVYKPEVYTQEAAKEIRKAADANGIEISAMFCGFYDNDTVWDLYYGFCTSGLNIEGYRAQRVRYVREAITFAMHAGIEDIVIHAGFVPNNPFAPEYATLLSAVKNLALHCKGYGMNLLLETGGEAPITMVRLIQDVAEENVFINFDPANILMYGFGNPLDAITVFGKYIRNMHGKDGVLPHDPRVLGEEKPVGQGMVDFPKALAMLKKLGYDRFITIEREITGEEQKRDILQAKDYLERLWNQA